MKVVNASEKEISAEIANWFRANGYRVSDVAKTIGCSVQSVSNHLHGKPFGKCLARKYSEAFGFSESFLVLGVGDLMITQSQVEYSCMKR